MPSKTPFADLTLYDISGDDINEKFLKFRTDIAGVDNQSNFNKIDTILANHNEEIQNRRRFFDAEAFISEEDNTKYFITLSDISGFYPSMILFLSLSDTNQGNVLLSINNSEYLEIKRYDINGNLVSLIPRELIKKQKYIIEFNTANFVLLSTVTPNEILEKIKTVHGSGSGLDADFLDGKDSTYFATTNQGTKADSAIQGIKGSSEVIIPDENKIVEITPENIGSIPQTRTINGKELSTNVNLNYADVGAANSTHTHDNATTTVNGFMSSSDKTKLNGIATGATKNTITFGTAAPSGGSHGDLYFRYS